MDNMGFKKVVEVSDGEFCEDNVRLMLESVVSESGIKHLTKYANNTEKLREICSTLFEPTQNGLMISGILGAATLFTPLNQKTEDAVMGSIEIAGLPLLIVFLLIGHLVKNKDKIRNPTLKKLVGALNKLLDLSSNAILILLMLVQFMGTIFGAIAKGKRDSVPGKIYYPLLGGAAIIAFLLASLDKWAEHYSSLTAHDTTKKGWANAFEGITFAAFINAFVQVIAHLISPNMSELIRIFLTVGTLGAAGIAAIIFSKIGYDNYEEGLTTEYAVDKRLPIHDVKAGTNIITLTALTVSFYVMLSQQSELSIPLLIASWAAMAASFLISGVQFGVRSSSTSSVEVLENNVETTPLFTEQKGIGNKHNGSLYSKPQGGDNNNHINNNDDELLEKSKPKDCCKGMCVIL